MAAGALFISFSGELQSKTVVASPDVCNPVPSKPGMRAEHSCPQIRRRYDNWQAIAADVLWRRNFQWNCVHAR